jgi:predicted metal-dependent peptidase
MAAEPQDGGFHSHRGTRAIQRLVEYAPSTGGLALWVKHADLPEAADAPANSPPDTRAESGTNDAPATPHAATEGHTIFYSAAFTRLPLAEQAFVLAHEVLHIALRHPQRCADLRRLLGDVDDKLFNTCADAIVNSTLSHLAWLQTPAGAVLLDALLVRSVGVDQAVDKSLLEWDVERLYRAVDDRRAGRNGKREDGPRSAAVRALGAGEPQDLMHSDATRERPEAHADAAREWSERLVRAHAGDGAFSMLRVLMADLPRTRTPWEQVLRTQLARALSTRPGISWSRPARSYIANQGRLGRSDPPRRLPWEPGFSGTRPVPRLVVIVDVSGSIEDALMDRFAREIEAITRRLEAGLVLVIGDDCVRRVAHFEPGRSDLREIQFNGGGGTDFTPLLEEADRHRPDIAIVLTDLDGPARWRPRWPVIWAVPEAHATAVAPFGRTLLLD